MRGRGPKIRSMPSRSTRCTCSPGVSNPYSKSPARGSSHASNPAVTRVISASGKYLNNHLLITAETCSTSAGGVHGTATTDTKEPSFTDRATSSCRFLSVINTKPERASTLNLRRRSTTSSTFPRCGEMRTPGTRHWLVSHCDASVLSTCSNPNATRTSQFLSCPSISEAAWQTGSLSSAATAKICSMYSAESPPTRVTLTFTCFPLNASRYNRPAPPQYSGITKASSSVPETPTTRPVLIMRGVLISPVE